MSVKEAVLPFHRFRRADGAPVDSLLGPEMRSTGEVMGIDKNFGLAFAKSQLAAYGGLPESGTVFVSVANRDKRAILPGESARRPRLRDRRHDRDGRCAAPQRNRCQCGAQDHGAK